MMLRRPSAESVVPWFSTGLLVILNIAGFAFTLAAFYPGVITVDALAVYRDVEHGFVGDWQSPVMGKVWGLIDPLARTFIDLPAGVAGATVSIFLLTVTLFWLGFAVLSLSLTHDSIALAILVPLLALSPPAFVMAGVIWRDILLAGAWLLARALTFATVNGSRWLSLTSRSIALLLLAFGLLLRPNALFAAPFVLAYILWPNAFRLKRAILLYPAAVIAGYGLVQFVYYGLLEAKRQHILHAVLVFDLGAITSITKENQFPGTWSEKEFELLKSGCYDPRHWDTYWRIPPCQFVMGNRLERDGVFGTAELVEAWINAVISHPLAYAQHRLSHFWAFLTSPHSAVYLQAIGKDVPMYPHNPSFMWLYQTTDALKETVIFRPLTWVAVVLATLVLSWRYRSIPAGSYTVAMSSSAIAYIATFLVFGVATDYRYVYWVVLVGLTCAVMTVLALQTRSTRVQKQDFSLPHPEEKA
jgi:hypothetical protein